MHRGTCEAMCERWTLEQRLLVSEGAKPQINPAQEKIHIFEYPDPRLLYNEEFRRLNNGKDPTVYDLVTMRYDRQWAEKSRIAGRSYEYRTSQALLNTIDYCMKWIIENDITNVWENKKITFTIVNNFIRDRARMVCVEFSSQKDALFGNLAAHQHELESREKTIRFLIYGTYMLCKDKQRKKDATTNQNNDEDAAAKQQNGERLTAMLTELGGAYERAKAAGLPIDPARIAEFREYQMYKLGTNLNNSFFATRDTRKVGDYDFLRVQSLETTISPEVLHQPHFSRCTAVFQCLRNHNYVRFFRILKDAPVLVAAMLYSLYGQHMRITGLSLISKLSPKEISLEQITRLLHFNGTQHARRFVQRHMLFRDHTPVQVVSKDGGLVIISYTSKPVKERATVYRLSQQYPDDLADFIDTRVQWLNLTRTDIVCGKDHGGLMPTASVSSLAIARTSAAVARELQQIMKRINSCSSAAKKAALATDELRPRLDAALAAGVPPNSRSIVEATQMIENLEAISKLLSRNQPVLLLRKKRLELTKLTNELAAASRDGQKMALHQKLLSCLKRVVAAGVSKTSPEVKTAVKVILQIEKEQARALKLAKLEDSIKKLVGQVSRASRLEEQWSLAQQALRPAMDLALASGVFETRQVIVAAKKMLTQLELRYRLDKVTEIVATAAKPEPRLSLARADLEPQIARVVAAGLPDQCSELVRARRMLEIIEAEAVLTPRGAKETPRRLKQVAEIAQELEAIHSDASRKGIVGTAVIADLFEGAEHALHELEQHTDARQTPTDVFKELCQAASVRRAELRTGITALQNKILNAKETRLRILTEGYTKLSALYSKSLGTDHSLPLDFKQHLDRLEPLLGAATESQLPLFSQTKALEQMQSDFRRILHQAQQHACCRLNAQVKKLRVSTKIRRRLNTWRHQIHRPSFCEWVKRVKNATRASQSQKTSPPSPQPPAENSRQLLSMNWKPLDLLRLWTAALCRSERFPDWQPFDQQKMLAFKCVVLTPPNDTVVEQDWLCRLLSGQSGGKQRETDAVLSFNRAQLRAGNKVISIVCKRTDTRRASRPLRRKLHGTHMLVAFVPWQCLERGRRRSITDVTRGKAVLTDVTTRIENALQLIGKGAQAVLLLVTQMPVRAHTRVDVSGDLLSMNPAEAHRFLVDRLHLQRWVANAQGTSPPVLHKCVLCPLSGEPNSDEARRRFASTLKSCAALTVVNRWVRPVQLSTIIEKMLEKITSYGKEKALSVYGVIDDWMNGDGKSCNGQLQQVKAILRNLVLPMPSRGHMGESAFAWAVQSQKNMDRFHYRVLQYLETSVGNDETRAETDAKRNLNVLMVKCVEDGVPIPARQIYNIFRDVIHCMAVKQDVRFDVDIRELSAATQMTLDDDVPDTQSDATAVVQACINDSWLASLDLVKSKPKYLLFQRPVNAVDGGGSTRSPASKKRKPQWNVTRSSRPQRLESETSGAPIPAQHKRTRTESDVLKSEPVLAIHRVRESPDYTLQKLIEQKQKFLRDERLLKQQLDEGDDISGLYRDESIPEHTTVHVGATASPPYTAREAASAPRSPHQHVESSSKNTQEKGHGGSSSAVLQQQYLSAERRLISFLRDLDATHS